MSAAMSTAAAMSSAMTASHSQLAARCREQQHQ
jgi:hypothetical protein